MHQDADVPSYELTNLVHGEEEAKKAEEAAKALFSGSGNLDNIPTTELTEEDFTDNKIDIIKMLTKSGLCSSNGDARRTITGGGVSVNNEKITEFSQQFEKEQFGEGLILRKGKKNYHKLVFKS